MARRPECQSQDGSEAAIPPDAVGPVLDDYSEEFGIQLLDDQHYETLENMMKSMDNEQRISLDEFLALVDALSASASSPPLLQSDNPDHSIVDEPERGREEERGNHSQSRSSSTDSVVTTFYRPEGSRRRSRPPSVSAGSGAQTANASPFDGQHRQRTLPLAGAPPSSFPRKPTAPSRRRRSSGGSAGNTSDGEVSVYFSFFSVRTGAAFFCLVPVYSIKPAC